MKIKIAFYDKFTDELLASREFNKDKIKLAFGFYSKWYFRVKKKIANIYSIPTNRVVLKLKYPCK